MRHATAQAPRPRVLLVGRTRFGLPLTGGLRRKFDALAERLELRVVGSARSGSSRSDAIFRLLPPLRPRAIDGPWFHLSLPFRVGWHLRRFDPDVVLVQGAHEAGIVLLVRAVVRRRARVVLDVHGDWRLATRLYGSRARRLLNVLADPLALVAVRRADALRTVSEFTSGLVRSAGSEPTAQFPPFIDFEPFLRPPAPLPDRPVALFVGVLERYKNVDALVAAWRLIAPQLPGAELRIVGSGSRASAVEALRRDLPAQTRWIPELEPEQVAAQLDAATCLVLPSASEGMGRVIVEALLRGRPVVGARTGATPELVRDGDNGVLVDAGDPRELASALLRVLSDRALAAELASSARAGAKRLVFDPSEYAASVLALVAAAVRVPELEVPAGVAAAAGPGALA